MKISSNGRGAASAPVSAFHPLLVAHALSYAELFPVTLVFALTSMYFCVAFTDSRKFMHMTCHGTRWFSAVCMAAFRCLRIQLVPNSFVY